MWLNEQSLSFIWLCCCRSIAAIYIQSMKPISQSFFFLAAAAASLPVGNIFKQHEGIEDGNHLHLNHLSTLLFLFFLFHSNNKNSSLRHFYQVFVWLCFPFLFLCKTKKGVSHLFRVIIISFLLNPLRLIHPSGARFISFPAQMYNHHHGVWSFSRENKFWRSCRRRKQTIEWSVFGCT